MSSAKMSQDAKKDEFRKYLEKTGVIDMLTKSLVQLYEEPDKPSDAVDYLKGQVGRSSEDKTAIEALTQENKELKEKLEKLTAGQAELEAKISALESSGAPPAPSEDAASAQPMEEATTSAPETAPDTPVTDPEPAAAPDQPAGEPAKEATPTPAEAVNEEPMETEAGEKETPAEESATTAPAETPSL